jgi:SH3 domain protein
VKRLIPLLFLLIVGCLQAEPRYITDRTPITMRAGEGTNHKIQRMLPAGERVEMLSSNRKTGYSRIRDSKGRTGFVLTRQLMPKPSARERVTVAENRYTEMKQRMENSIQPFLDLQQRHRELKAEYSKLEGTSGSLDTELKELKEVSSDAIRIAEERKELRKQLASQTWELENLKQENQELKNDQAQYWFLVGAGVIILGIIIGMILPHLQTRSRKQSW